MDNKTFIIFYGPPGSGKGTQVKLLAQRLQLPAISTGDLLRSEIKDQTELGKRVEAILASGGLVSDEIVQELIIKQLEGERTAKGAIFDGFPRRLSQQEFLLEQLGRVGGEAKIIPILIDVDDEEVVKRISGRRVCSCGAVFHIPNNPPKTDGICDVCGQDLVMRDDDKPEVIRQRLKAYHGEINPMLAYWQGTGQLVTVDGGQDIPLVDKELMEKLKGIL
ncbi:nucleoside monophosphate kinase [Candidatus Falkowbacteria bacterium]|nr:nucleoside monophosphate kinase [Candidatus Falkowbacteria bacterium]